MRKITDTMAILRKVVYVLFVIAVVFGTNANATSEHENDIETDPEMEKYLREAMENFREQMKVGIPAINMPVLDPLELRNLDVNVHENLATLTLHIKEMEISNLSLFDVTNLRPNLEKFFLQINLSLPELFLHGHYELDGKLLKILPLYGVGYFEINATEICIAGKGQLKFANGTLQMGLLKLDLIWQHISVYLENFLKGGDFSEVLQRVIPGVGRDVFVAYKPIILEKLETALTRKINEKLNDPFVNEIIQGILPEE